MAESLLDDRRLESFKHMKELMTNYYIEAKTADQHNKKVAWVTSGAPVEILHAMDIIPIYPENHAAMCSVQRMGEELQLAAEEKGFSMDLCSYARTDIGSIHTGKSPVFGLPRPDFMVACNNICTTVVKWYEAVSRLHDCPVFMVDMPFLTDGLQDHVVDYAAGQLKELIAFLEKMTGKTFDNDRFLDVLLKSMETTNLWGDILDTSSHSPAPMSCFDAFIHIGPIVTLRGTQGCVDYYKILKKELEGRIESKMGAIPEERHRLLWDNLPIWFNLRDLSESLARWKTCLVAATYTDSWRALVYTGEGEEELKMDTILHELAKAYLMPYINHGFPERVRILKGMLEKYNADGFLMHSDRSCKPYSLGQYILRDQLTKETGILGLVIEADMADPRQYAEAPTMNRIEAYLESLG
jgi:bcr-type benzoyl-CoA reductase subunit B